MAEAADALSRLHELPGPAQGQSGGECRGNRSVLHRPLKHTAELFWHYWLPVLVMLTAIAVESTDLFSGAHTGHFLNGLFRWLGHPLSPQQLELLNHAMRKCGHVLGYGTLCLSWLLLLRGSWWLRHEYQLLLKGGVQIRRIWWRPVWGLLAVFATYAVASADEFHQMSMPSRTGAWHDIGLDTTAAFIAMLLFRAKALRHCKG